MSGKGFYIRKATSADLDAIKALVDSQKHELGFVSRAALARSIARREVLVAENSAGLIGFVEYHHRQDEQTTLYHIAVAPDHRRRGVGRALIDALCSEALALGKQAIQLKCPVGLPAHSFYAHLRFNPLRKERGKNRPLIVWSLSLMSSEVSVAD